MADLFTECAGCYYHDLWATDWPCSDCFAEGWAANYVPSPDPPTDDE